MRARERKKTEKKNECVAGHLHTAAILIMWLAFGRSYTDRRNERVWQKKGQTRQTFIYLFFFYLWPFFFVRRL